MSHKLDAGSNPEGRFMTLPEPDGKIWSETHEARTPDKTPARFTLTDYADEWHFFNLGAFFTHAEFRYPHEDPVADWYATQPYGTVVLQQLFKHRIIDGLAPVPNMPGVTWGNVVWAVRNECWPSLFEFLGGVCGVNRKTGFYFRAFSGDLQIPDPVTVERHSLMLLDVPTVTLTVFCVDGNTARWEVRPAATALASLRMVEMPPRAEVQAVAQSVLHGDLATLKYNDNSAFQAHLDKYKQLTGKDPSDAIARRIADKH